jgi:hypothetical protein
MKKKLHLLIVLMLFCNLITKAQIVSDFENLLLPMPPLGAFWDGSDQSGGFVSGGMYFPNSYDTSFGGFWADGFAYSSVIDSVTSGFANLYGAKPAAGYNGSSNYAVAQQNTVARLNNVVPTMVIGGFYVTNGTYAYNSMRSGDTFARKFGDTTGTGSGLPQGSYPDFFKLTVKSYVSGQLSNDSVEFYLADFRFNNDSLDYIVSTWEWVDCSILAVFDSLKFTLSSSDNGSFGMNTPAFFCIDNLTIDVTVGNSKTEMNHKEVQVFPNPANEVLYFKNVDINHKTLISIFNINGQLILENSLYHNHQALDISELPKGFYSIKVQTENATSIQKFVKQ